MKSPSLTLGARLKEARKTTDYTQEQVAEILDVHHFTYAKWEQDLHPPGKKRYLDDLSLLYNCSVGWLRDGEGEKETYTPEPKTDRSRKRVADTTPCARPNLSTCLPTPSPAQQIVLQMVTSDILGLSDDELLLWHTRYMSSKVVQKSFASRADTNRGETSPRRSARFQTGGIVEAKNK